MAVFKAGLFIFPVWQTNADIIQSIIKKFESTHDRTKLEFFLNLLIRNVENCRKTLTHKVWGTVVRAGLTIVPFVPWHGAPRRRGAPAATS